MKDKASLEDGENQQESSWLIKCRNAFNMSKTYFDSNYQQDIDDSIKMFNSEHPQGSKYNRPSFQYRSKIFRPKTRSAIRKNEAAGTSAFFSGFDSFDISALNADDEEGEIAADVMKEIISYRLSNTIPWFQTCIGGLQDAQKTGVVASYNYWEYKELRTKVKEPLLNSDGEQEVVGGEPQFTETDDVEVIVDRPKIQLIPVDQLRFHPAADWTDPINNSPFLIRQIPYYLHEVEARMKESNDKTGETKWKKYNRTDILHVKIDEFSSTRSARSRGKQDAQSQETPENSEYTMVWVHENIISVKSRDYIFYTLGTKYMLTEPVPLKEVYWHGERPYTMGCVVLETHTTISPGIAQLGKSLQEEANDIANSRLDNVKLVLQKRYIAKRGAQVDLKSITRNVPGSVTMVDNVGDVVPMEFQDVTSSSYAEQDRINLDYDELVGSFSQSSVQSNRKMNETVGGMNLVQSSASQMTDYMLRTFAETWLEPTIRQLVKLEAKYETDELIFAVAMKKSKLMLKYGKSPKIDDLLNKELLVKVDVGLGVSNPQFRLDRFLFAIQKFSQIASQAPKELDIGAVARELFGYLGYKSGDRFLLFDEQNDDPKYQQLTQTIDQMQQALDKTSQDNDQKMAIEQLKQDAESQRSSEKVMAELIMADMKEDGKFDMDQIRHAMQFLKSEREPEEAPPEMQQQQLPPEMAQPQGLENAQPIESPDQLGNGDNQLF